MTRDLELVVPCLAPASISHHEAWAGPRGELIDDVAGVTWVIPGADGITYVSNKKALEWEAQGLDWRRTAWDNLVARTPSVWTHALEDDGGAVFAVLMLHDDGLGPSRLAFYDELQELLGDGYLALCPERASAIAFRATLSSAERARVETFVRKSTGGAGTPFFSEPVKGSRIARAIQSSCHLWESS